MLATLRRVRLLRESTLRVSSLPPRLLVVSLILELPPLLFRRLVKDARCLVSISRVFRALNELAGLLRALRLPELRLRELFRVRFRGIDPALWKLPRWLRGGDGTRRSLRDRRIPRGEEAWRLERLSTLPRRWRREPRGDVV